MVEKHNQTRSGKSEMEVRRRWVLGMLSAGAVGGLAGCGGTGDDGTPTSTPGSDDTPTETDEPMDSATPGDTDTATPEPRQVYDVTAVSQGFSLPEEISNYQQFATDDASVFTPNGYGSPPFWQAPLSGEIQGNVVSDWEYSPGVMTATLHDDFFYWDGSPVDAENVVVHSELGDLMAEAAGDEPGGTVTDVSAVDDYTVRWTLDDTYSEGYALATIFDGLTVSGATHYYGPWVEDFKNAGSDEELASLLEEIETTVVDDPNPFFYNPFKVVDATENSFIWELRDDEDPLPHYVDQFNYRYLETVNWTENARMTQSFVDQEMVWDHGDAWTEEDVQTLDFDTARVFNNAAEAEWSFTFNTTNPPFSNPHFRRAITYMVDANTLARPIAQVEANDKQTPFKGSAQYERYVSQDMLDQLEDFGLDEVREEDATREMERGGFERNSDGQWLYQEGDNAGEPITLTVHRYNFYSFWDNVIEQFHNVMTDWGIETDSEEYGALWGELGNGEQPGLTGNRWGGGIPAVTMGINFGNILSNWSGNPNLPDTVEAPPVGEPWSEYDGELETFETRRMAQQLPVMQDQEQMQEIVDTLTWVYNQVCPRIGVENNRRSWVLNNTKWSVKDPDENPDLWLNEPQKTLAWTPAVDYVPEEER